MTYLHGHVSQEHIDAIAENIINGNRNDARDLILGYSDYAIVACLTLLVVDAYARLSGVTHTQASNEIYRLLEAAVR